MLLSLFAGRSISVGLAVLGSAVAFGQDYPNKPVRIITAAAGGGSDFMARQIGQGIQGALGQPVVVDNRAGAIFATEAVVKTPPDGYSLLVAGASLWITPLLQKVSYDAVRDFAPISLVSREVLILAVHPSLSVNSVKELIALAKARPGELNYGSALTGSPGHLGMEMFKSMANLNIVRVAYKGTPPAVTALIGGEVQVVVTDAGLVAPHQKTGKMKALAVSSATPSALAPGLPTIADSGVPGYELVGATGIWAPAKTPAAIVARLSQEVVRGLNQPGVKERLLGAGEELVASSPEQFAAWIKADTAKMNKVITDAGIKVE